MSTRSKSFMRMDSFCQNRYEVVHDRLRDLRDRASTNEIEKALRHLWNFDERFFGALLPFTTDDYAWAAYSLE